MTTTATVQVTPQTPGGLSIGSLSSDSAKLTSELLQENHEKHHIYFSKIGMHSKARLKAPFQLPNPEPQLPFIPFSADQIVQKTRANRLTSSQITLPITCSPSIRSARPLLNLNVSSTIIHLTNGPPQYQIQKSSPISQTREISQNI